MNVRGITDGKYCTYPARRKIIKPMADSNEQMKLYTSKGADILADRAEREVPENGKFTHIFVSFDIPDSTNEAIIEITHDNVNPKDKRNVLVNVHQKASDIFVTNNMFTGTKREVINYLRENKTHEDILSSVKELSLSSDRIQSEL